MQSQQYCMHLKFKKKYMNFLRLWTKISKKLVMKWSLYNFLICPSRYWNSDLYWIKSSTNQNSNFY
jgi:hypothetical protein